VSFFEHYEPQSGGPFPVGSVSQLLVLPNGDLWIVFRTGGICRLMAAESGRDVALEIYKAATDGSRHLRYFIGVDSGGLLKAIQTLPDQEYIEFMLSDFRSGEGA
jgi:hypothetical protein